MLSLSRMRADAKSLMIYWRRTCLNTERKGKPSSVSKKGSFSHRSVGQRRFSRTNTKTRRETRRSPVVPVLRLHSQASASARSCLIGPSHKVLSCRNIHCRGRNRKRRLWKHEGAARPSGNYVCAPFSEPCTHPFPPA